ncbi:MAG: MHS family MFS transporter, partial [Alphaproteobacteria bacterium]
ILRPFGAIFFGHLGDLIGRKFTFMLTLGMMGLATFLVGCVPSYATWGLAAPIIILLMRGMQGLALGGEYGGAATYIAEHAPDGKRGLYTSWIQTTATMGIVLALLAVLICRQSMSVPTEEAAMIHGKLRVPVVILRPAASADTDMTLSQTFTPEA